MHVTGGHYGGFDTGEGRKDILEFVDGNSWRKVGTMKDVRYDHATSLVEFKDYEDYLYCS